MTFFQTFLTLPVARPVAQMYCPHLGNRHPLHLGHPHLHLHFPRGNGEKSLTEIQNKPAPRPQNHFPLCRDLG